MTIDRRSLIGGLATAGAALTLPRQVALAQTKPSSTEVVIVGAGAGGATLAVYLRRLAPEISVTIIERNAQLTTNFFSNHVASGLWPIERITHSYDRLASLGIKFVRDIAIDVDPVRKSVTLLGGTRIGYDRLVLSPGVDLKLESIEGYSSAATKVMPHAWRAGEQTTLLRSKLEGLSNGGTVLLSIPAAPFSCPPAAYERACLIAYFLKTTKPRSKLIVLDANKSFDLQNAFLAAFERNYKNVLEYLPSSDGANFGVAAVDPSGKAVTTKGGITFKAEVANIIPPQNAGGIAVRAWCVEADWCPIDPDTFLSLKTKDIHVIGDASMAADMPRSAYAASSQAKLLASVLAGSLAGKENFPSRMREVLWSFITPDQCLKSGGTYAVGLRNGRNVLIGSDQFSSTADDLLTERKADAETALGWYEGITSDMLGTSG